MESPKKVWLDVPFDEKDLAKVAGARWDTSERRWYAPAPAGESLSRWAAQPDVPDLLPGEDRTFGAGLFVDPIPSSCWFTNVRSCVDKRDWERLRRMIVDRAGGKCEACGRVPDRSQRQWTEAHERWEYDAERSVQSLRWLICLCTACHQTTHFGLAQIQGKEDEAMANLMAVNDWTRSAAELHVRQAFETWSSRCDIDWDLDLSILTDAGLRIGTPTSRAARRVQAAERLEERRAHQGEPA